MSHFALTLVALWSYFGRTLIVLHILNVRLLLEVDHVYGVYRTCLSLYRA